MSAGERFPRAPPDPSPQTNPSFVLLTSKTVQPQESQPLPTVHCERGDQTPPSSSRSPDLLPAPQQEPRPRSDSPQTGREEILTSEPLCVHPSTAETNQCPTEEDASTGTPVNNPRLEEAVVHVSGPAEAHDSKEEVELGLSELDAGLVEDSPRSAAHCEETPPAVPLSPVAEDQQSPGLTEADSTSEVQTVLNTAVESGASAWRRRDEEDKVSQILRENVSEVSPQSESELGVDVNLKPSFVFVSVAVLLSIAVQQPNVLVLIGLLLVLQCF